ncbi:hypothetical protein [Brevibacillus porteri]|uniref:Uncharacterized protein n=1 Tax=Brevibacillus porteri TaxID=2126350 RepID=A0ABX5FS91_9BACL|nr:hypothetical protein [Brevibacillus porteri]MED1801818.1 hypothetical protein [Brevibacillus porteri]MED2134949.1 hypothetical protein [Brevibacillus porteri]MED2745471.1 hypothetical protein [Brevibacillus porteri]MED2815783.1 hypothetical protein [Brevibacillus porteri]MED2897621.1 hypothetical protein [Brevibacillus porteri]
MEHEKQQQVRELEDKVKRYEMALIEIEALVFCNEEIPVKFREAIQKQVVLKAGVNPPRKRE